MNLVLLVLRAHLKSSFSAVRNDSRTKVAMCVALCIHVGVGLWAIDQLLEHMSQWLVTGPIVLETHLWLLCIGAWTGIGLFTALSTMTLGFGGNQPRLLMTLPIPGAARFRILYGLMFVVGIGNWLLFEVGVIGIPLIITLGLQALQWLLLLLLGIAVTVWVSIVATLLVLRYVLPHFKKALLLALLLCIGSGSASMVLHMLGMITQISALSAPVPLFVSLLLIVVLALVIGPGAPITGHLYEQAFHKMEGLPRSRAIINVPGIQLLSKLLRRNRNLTGALLVKGLRNQSRNVFTWGRVVIVLVCIALFPLIETLLTPLGFSKMLLAVVYVCGVAILAIIDYAPYAVSSEGSRLIFYLVAQSGITGYLRSRLMVHVIATLLIGMALSLGMSWWIGLTPLELALVVMMVSLIVISYTAFSVLGSTWDVDLNLVSEGMMPTLTQEELPFTPRRLQLLGLSFLLLGVIFLLIWKLPLFLLVLALLLLNAVVLGLGWRFSSAQLRALLN